jgi:hypothetical protein
MPVDGPSYLVGRTDARVTSQGTNYRCLWTGPNMTWGEKVRYVGNNKIGYHTDNLMLAV